MAQPGTRLPEQVDRDRNYDYRYAWIRDQAFAGIAAARAGALDLLDAATGFAAARLLDDGPELKPAYTVAGGPVPSERSLDLTGYPGGTDKTGNWVNEQFQLDAFGEALQLLATAARLGRLDQDGWRAACTAADAIAKRWTEPDPGIWELGSRRWTHSRLACVAGLRAVAALPSPGTGFGDCAALADAVMAETARTATHPDGHWQRADDDPRPDAALLLPPVRGAVPAADPKTTATLHVVRDQLGGSSTSTGSGTTSARSATPRERSCSAGSSWRWPSTSKATSWLRPLLRAQPRRLRTARPAVRGIRRHPATAPRQPAPGARARPAG